MLPYSAGILLLAAAASGHSSLSNDAASRIIPDVAHDPDGQCSNNQDDAVLLSANAVCPPSCPFSLSVEGIRCDKVCVKAEQCGDFNPVRRFPDVGTMRCEGNCGASPDQMIAGCAECEGPGICKRCSRGLFGFTVLELSDDKQKCINHSRKIWFSGYTIVGILAVLFVLNLVRITLRPADDGADEKLRQAMDGRDRIRTQLMLGPRQEWGVRDNVDKAALAHGGLGVALYFRWLVFSLLVAFIMAAGSFYAFQMSDLARHMSDLARSKVACDASATVTEMTQTDFNVRLQALADKGVTPTAESAEKNPLSHHPKKKTAEPSISSLARAKLDRFTDDIAERIRELSAPLIGGKRTEGIQQRYEQFHRRIFFTSLVVYIIVTLLCWVFAVLQLRIAADSFDSDCSMKDFAAVISGLPPNLVDGRELTEQIKDALMEESAQGTKWKELWQTHSKNYEDHMGDWNEVPLEARFKVVGTSIAFDFYEHQNEVNDEIHCLVNDLTDNRPLSPGFMRRLATKPQATLTNPEQQWTLGTQRYGQILEAVKLRQEQKGGNRFFDQFLERMVGLEPDWQYVLQGSGKAFIVFATQVARDAVVSRARRGELEFQWNVPDSAGENSIKTHKLHAKPAPCEPISVYWENFSDWLHFSKKIGLGILLMIATSLTWMALYLPYAAFYADLVVIPGLEPSFVQDMLLGLLIAVGNAIVSVVIDRVTDWAGFFYKHNRDIAVLNLAFLGTLANTAFDLAMVSVVAKGVQMESSFKDNDVGYNAVAANEVFKLIVPGYLLVPYLGGPFVDRCMPLFLAYILIRSSARVTIRSAVESMKFPEFDICWRYADILNNTTICMVLLFFTSSKAWKVMCCLAAFLLLIYSIDKVSLLKFSTTSVYDTDKLSIAFARWWCAPTTVLAILVAYWGHRARFITPFYCVLLPLEHIALYLMVMYAVEARFRQRRHHLRWYPDVVREMRESSDSGEAWDFFNTNPIFCIRAHRLGAEESGWKAIRERTNCVESAHWSSVWAARRPRPDWAQDECRPFVRGQVRLSPKDELLSSRSDKRAASV